MKDIVHVVGHHLRLCFTDQRGKSSSEPSSQRHCACESDQQHDAAQIDAAGRTRDRKRQLVDQQLHQVQGKKRKTTLDENEGGCNHGPTASRIPDQEQRAPDPRYDFGAPERRRAFGLAGSGP
jgi:hypothetical protein